MDIRNNRKNIHKGISRIDSKTTKGWLVRGYKNGIRYSKLFSDRKLGGEDIALSKAIVCRNELAARLCAIPSKPRSQKIVSHDKRNQTGVLGVSKLSKNGKGNKKLGFYSVTWRPAKGKQKCTSFSIAKYGEDLAFKKAVSLRYDRLCAAYGKEIATRIVGKKNVEEFVLQTSKEPDVADTLANDVAKHRLRVAYGEEIATGTAGSGDEKKLALKASKKSDGIGTLY